MKRTTGIVFAVLMAMTMTGCGISVPSDMVAIQMGDGWLENKVPKGCLAAGTKDNSITNDEYPKFPNSEREWDATGQDGSDSGRFSSVTKDNVEMLVPTTVRFTLITECKQLTKFYLKYARRNGVEFKDDGTYNKAWLTTLRKLVADPADAALDRIVQDYNWRDVWNNPAIKVEIEKRLNDSVDDLMKQTAKDDYFEGISVLIGKPAPKNADLAKAVASEQTKVAESVSAKAQAEADQAKAEAQIAVSRAEAEKRKAEVAGYGGPENYLKALCIQENPTCNPWQPTVLGYGANAPK